MERKIPRAQYPDVEATAPQETTLTPREKRIIGEHWARTVLIVSAVLAGLGAAAVEKSDSFDPLASSVDSANHLVLNNLHRAYGQLIDELPSVKTAEAAPPAPSVSYPSSKKGIPNRTCDPDEIIDFTPHSKTLYVGQRLTFTVDACLNADPGVEVRLVEMDTFPDPVDETLSKIIVSSEFQSMSITFDLDCVDGGWLLPNKLVGFNGYSQDVGGGAQLAIETDYAGLGWEIGNSYDNNGSETGAAQISCLDCPSGETCSYVGGVAELPDVQASSQNIDSQPSKDNTVPIAAGLAAAAGALTAGGALLYSRRRR